jgi:hypothetical protein
LIDYQFVVNCKIVKLATQRRFRNSHDDQKQLPDLSENLIGLRGYVFGEHNRLVVAAWVNFVQRPGRSMVRLYRPCLEHSRLVVVGMFDHSQAQLRTNLTDFLIPVLNGVIWALIALLVVRFSKLLGKFAIAVRKSR